MRPHFLSLIIPFLYVSLQAQLIDNFSDGDFFNNPTWQGDTNHFIINSNNQLQLNAPSVTDTSFLVVETGILDFTNIITWEFYVKLDLSPSNSNNFRYYLTSNNANLRGNVDGYFIRVGENGSTDKIKLYRQDGTSTTLLMTGLNGAYGVNPEFRVRVNRDINGNWEVLSDSIGGTSYVYEGGATDNTHQFSTFSGVWCKRTTSNTDNFYFDDIEINGNVINDNNPPQVYNSFVKGANTIEIQYDEPVTSSAEQINNYNLNFNNGNPLLVTVISSGYELLFNNAFISNDTLVLDINNIQDLSGNVLDTTIEIIVPDTASAGDILFNELLFDPYAGGSDYVEFFNTSNSNIDLYHYFIADYDASDGEIGNYKQISEHHVISPSDVVCFTEDEYSTISDFITHGVTKIVQMDLPSFPNDSATIYLLTPDSNLVDKFSYSEDMHYELINDTEGISLEKIISNENSGDFSNWTSAAESVGWGTPGVENSQRFNQLISTNQFEVQTAVFSPDNDGFEDVAVFSYQLMDSDMVGNASIYDKTGRLIKRVLINKLLGIEGQFTWDGTNFNNQKAGIGIYLIHFEAFGENGNIITHKKSITLKTRF